MKEGPREKLKKYGVSYLTDEELLALILRTGYEGKNVIELAKFLLKNYSLNDFLTLDYSHLKKIKGLGEVKSASLIAAIEFAKRCQEKSLAKITKAEHVLPYVSEIKDKKKENLVALYLNVKNIMVKKEYISIGTLDSSLIHPREVFVPAIESHASKVILVHNHPSGDVTPSKSDVEITAQVKKAGEIIGIELLDHIIVAGDNFYSFNENNIL